MNDNNLTVTPVDMTKEDAANLTHEIQELQSRSTYAALELGTKLEYFFEVKGWIALGHRTADEWIKNSDILLKRTTIYNLIAVSKTYRTLKIKCEMFDISFTKDQFIALPYSKIVVMGKQIELCETGEQLKALLAATAKTSRRSLVNVYALARIRANITWISYNFQTKRAVFEINAFHPDISPETVKSFFVGRDLDMVAKALKPKKVKK